MKGKWFLSIGMAMALTLVVLAGLALAQQPAGSPLIAAFTYQGRLASSGLPYTGACDLQFGLWDALTGGTQVGGTQTVPNVDLVDGYFTVMLDWGADKFFGEQRWLEIQVRCPAGGGPYTPLAPRQMLTAAPQALFAMHASWPGLLEVPPGFSDGIDNDTTYGAGVGLTISGTILSADTSYLQQRVGGACGSGFAIREVNQDGSVTCEPVGGGGGDAWLLTGNSGTTPGVNYVGTTDNAALVFKVNNQRALRLEPNATSPNVVGGNVQNWAYDGVYGAAIGGGGNATETNVVTDLYGTIGGGAGNQAGDDAGSTDDAPYATVSGGYYNTASDVDATVGGGQHNTASGVDATVGGGQHNTASGVYATVGGGYYNIASGNEATIGGGGVNEATGENATVGGGHGNDAIGLGATIGGGHYNTASDDNATVGGGGNNTAGGWAATVGGGYVNTASANYATVSGGYSNTASIDYATIGGGVSNIASGNEATIGGGYSNAASGTDATVGGGSFNTAIDDWATVAGGFNNDATGSNATVAGGAANTASGDQATVGGGDSNAASGYWATIGGGYSNTASGTNATVGGGVSNSASYPYCTVSGGYSNTTSADYATVGGGDSNAASGYWSTIGGGYSNTANGDPATVGGGYVNTASGDVATVGGGGNNTASGWAATVGGGWYNTASDDEATVAGGSQNTASGEAATVPGGSGNVALGDYSFAAGRQAKAYYQGCFVWGDSTDAHITCDNQDRWVARASGGVYFYTNASATSGMYLAAGGSSWNAVSARALKENFAPVDGAQLLERLAGIEIATWNYKAQDPAIRHVGPMAEDFNALLDGLGGEGADHINTLDADGVALAAIQALYARNQALEAENADQQAQIDALAKENAGLDARLTALEQAVQGGRPAQAGTHLPVPWLVTGGLVVAGGGALAGLRRRPGGGR